MLCHLFDGIGDAKTKKERSVMNGPKRNTRGRDITWLSIKMIQSSEPTHIAISPLVDAGSSSIVQPPRAGIIVRACKEFVS